MSFKVVNKVDRDFRWDNGSNPYGFNIPFPTTEDNGKVLSVVEGKYNLTTGSSGETTIYFDLRLNTTDSTLSVTDTEYTVSQINSIVYSYTTPVVLRVQYDETDEYRLFSLYRIEETDHVTKWCSTVSTNDSGVVIFNDLININDDGTLTFLRREVNNLTAGNNISISDQNAINCTISYATSSSLGLVKIPDRSPISNIYGNLEIKACGWFPDYSTGRDTGCDSNNASSYQYPGKIYKICSSGTVANATSSVVDKVLFTMPNLVDVLSCSFVFRNAGTGPWLFAANSSNANNPLMEISVSTDGEFIAKTKANSSFRYNATIIYIVPNT